MCSRRELFRCYVLQKRRGEEEGMRIDNIFWTPIDSPVFLKRLEAFLMHQIEVIEE